MRYRSIRGFIAMGVFASVYVAYVAAQTPTQSEPSGQPQASSGAQSAPSQQPSRFRVESNFVRVDAYPVKDGKPVFDLNAQDFEVFEDGAVQKIESFEHVVVRAAGPQTERVEVSSQRESLQAAANPRNRVFVIFLDTPHVAVESANAINEPLIRLLNRILGPDDLVGVMTPEMSASQVVLGRKTQVIEDSLRSNWAWGRRNSILRDEREDAYVACYPSPSWSLDPDHESPLARELIARKRERATLEAIEDLVRYLRTVREERKAILTVTEGWLLYGENPSLLELQRATFDGRKEPIPGVDPVRVGSNGKLTTKDPRDITLGALSMSECNTDRMRLAMLNNKQFFLDLLDEANFANASFYPVDPRGLTAFDTPIGPVPPPTGRIDQAMLKQRTDTMRTLADNTDGMAVVKSNDLDEGLRRISDDLTSYYLLGYYSSNAKLDGQFRSLKVRVKKPGVSVRARRGYRAATEAEVATARLAADPPVPDAARAVTSAIEQLSRIRSESVIRINAVTSGGVTPALWIAGELPASGGHPDDFSGGGTVDLEITANGSSKSSRVILKAGERTFLTSQRIDSVASGEITVRARVTSGTGGTIPVSDVLRFDAAGGRLQPLLFRRGVTTGNRVLPAADRRFSRTERLRLDIPVDDAAKPGVGRVLDRSGQPVQVPVTVGERRDDAASQRWITADVVLAPLAGGDYAIEIEIIQASKSDRVLSAIRVVR